MTKEIRFTIDGIEVVADSYSLLQIINNIVDNAVKYTEKGSITISVEKTEGKVNLIFRDTGVGINSEFLEIFAVYRLLALKGALLPTLELEYPRESKVASGDQWSTEEKMEAR